MALPVSTLNFLFHWASGSQWRAWLRCVHGKQVDKSSSSIHDRLKRDSLYRGLPTMNQLH